MSKGSLAAGITQTWLFLALVLCRWLKRIHMHMDTCTLSCTITDSAASTEAPGSPVSPTSPLPYTCGADLSQPVAPLLWGAAWRWMLFRAQLGYSLLPNALFPPWAPSLLAPGRDASPASSSTADCPNTWRGVKPRTCRLQKPKETQEEHGMPSTALGHRELGSAYCIPTLLGHSRGINKRSWKSKCAIKIMI